MYHIVSLLACNVAWCERVASTIRCCKSELVCVASWGCLTWDTLYYAQVLYAVRLNLLDGGYMCQVFSFHSSKDGLLLTGHGVRGWHVQFWDGVGVANV